VAKPTTALAGGIVAILVLVPTDGVGASRQRDSATSHASLDSADTRVRTDDLVLSTLIRQAMDRSPTFRRIVDAIQASDGIVYIQRDQCRHYVQSCLVLWMGFAGPNRVLRVNVAGRKTDIEMMSSIGHELRHALEVLDEPGLRSGARMYNWYKHNHAWRGETFETLAAVEAGDAVYRELKRSMSIH